MRKKCFLKRENHVGFLTERMLCQMRIAGKFDYIHFADKCSQLLYYKTEKNSAVKKYKNDSLSPSETVESQFVRSIHFFEPSLWLPVNNFPGFPL